MKRYVEQRDLIFAPQADSAMNSRPREAVLLAEAAFSAQIEDVSNWAILNNRHVILLAGPSSSGKTTTAKMLARALTLRGKHAHRISLDDFYKDRDQLPLWPDGTINFEAVEGLDLDLLSRLLIRLAGKGSADFPVFDFATGRRSPEKTFTLEYTPDTYLVIEGIHALNPLLRQAVGDDSMGVYVSVHSDFADDQGNVLLNARQLRLIRRIIRDRVRRKSPAQVTLDMWDNVMKGEELYIRPFRHLAEAHLDSTHLYEPYLYHDALLHALEEEPISQEYLEQAQALRGAEAHFFQMDMSLVPADSLVQEFIQLS